MTIKLAILKSGEDIIADIKEVVSKDDDKILSYVFSNPYVVKLITQQILTEETNAGEYSVSFFPWIPLSNDTEIFVNTDWVVSIVEPTEGVKKSYEEKMNERNRSSNGRRNSRVGNDGNSGIGNSPDSTDESVEFN